MRLRVKVIISYSVFDAKLTGLRSCCHPNQCDSPDESQLLDRCFQLAVSSVMLMIGFYFFQPITGCNFPLEHIDNVCSLTFLQLGHSNVKIHANSLKLKLTYPLNSMLTDCRASYSKCYLFCYFILIATILKGRNH